jgi:PPK2 family polyphosphate:nucleotide phosphotransferase
MPDLIERARRFAQPYRVDHGKRFRLQEVDPDDRGDLTAADKPRAQEALAHGIQAMADLQDRLYAQDRWAVLLVFQAIDAAGKDSAIKHVMSGVNPQGCEVFSFKSASSEDLDHDYLWRCVKALPERRRIGIFNRSYYEEVVVVRVHPELLERQKVPPKLLATKNLWKDRYRDILNFESYLSRNGTLIRKFFLHVSRKEQEKRFRERLERPEKNW